MIPRPLKIGIGGPVGSGKTALAEALCLRLRDRVDMAVITNDIYTKEDAEFLVRRGALPPARVRGVETGGCPHTAIREDAEALLRVEALSPDRIVAVETGCCPHTAIRDDVAANLDAVEELGERLPGLELVLIESGGDNLTATFSPALADLQLFVIDVAGGDKVPRKGGPGVIRSDLLVINKVDLALLVGADLDVMARDAARQRGERPVIFASVAHGQGVEHVARFIEARL